MLKTVCLIGAMAQWVRSSSKFSDLQSSLAGAKMWWEIWPSGLMVRCLCFPSFIYFPNLLLYSDIFPRSAFGSWWTPVNSPQSVYFILLTVFFSSPQTTTVQFQLVFLHLFCFSSCTVPSSTVWPFSCIVKEVSASLILPLCLYELFLFWFFCGFSLKMAFADVSLLPSIHLTIHTLILWY